MERIIFSIYPRHDANIAIGRGNKILKFIELEKVSNERYFSFERHDKKIFTDQFKELAYSYLKGYDITTVLSNWLNEIQLGVLREFFPKAKQWISYPHHSVHAWSAYVFIKPQEMDLIVSYDGGGELSDYFRIFTYRNEDIHLLSDIRINLGKPYRLLGLLSPELCQDTRQDFTKKPSFSLSGKIMALAALSKINNSYLKPVEKFYNDFHFYGVQENFRELLEGLKFKDRTLLPKNKARDLLATSQYVFEQKFKRHVYPYLKEKRYKRLIIVGGCGLNVTMNSIIEREFRIPIFVPPCPNDCGLSLGLQKMYNHRLEIIKKPMVNLPIKNYQALQAFRKNFVHKKALIKDLAKMLSQGEIIAVIRGPLEIGPRALGNRSLLANPLIKGMKDRLNLIKGREFWRPVAPIVSWEKSKIYFDILNPSPYMSFAPKVRAKYRKLLNEIIHYDDSARLQTVNRNDGWIYNLIKQLGKLTNFEILMNTSFNKKGRPLVNDYQEALDIFTSSGIDGIVIENELFYKLDINHFPA